MRGSWWGSKLWLSGRYAIPAPEQEADEAAAGRDADEEEH